MTTVIQSKNDNIDLLYEVESDRIGVVFPEKILVWAEEFPEQLILHTFVNDHLTAVIEAVRVIHVPGRKLQWLNARLNYILETEAEIPEDVEQAIRRLIVRIVPYLRESERRGYIKKLPRVGRHI